MCARVKIWTLDTRRQFRANNAVFAQKRDTESFALKLSWSVGCPDFLSSLAHMWGRLIPGTTQRRPVCALAVGSQQRVRTPLKAECAPLNNLGQVQSQSRARAIQ